MFKEEEIPDVSHETEVSEENYTHERNKPMPNFLHGNLQSDLVFQLRLKYDDQFSFPTEVSLDLKPGATPDILIYPIKNKIDRSEVPAKMSEMPLTTIEIISPSQSIDKMATKIRTQYFPAGVKSAWLVVPAFKAIYVMLPDGKNLHFDSGELTDPTSGIQVSVDKIFERVV